MKKFLHFIFFVLVIALFFNIAEVYALNITDYKFDVIFDNGKVFQSGGTSIQRNFPGVIRTTVFNNAIRIEKGHKYRLYMTYEYTSNHGYIAVDQEKLFVGNYSWNEWNLGTSYYYNLDSQHDLGNGFYLLEYGQVVEFTSEFTSNGISQDFYYNDSPNFTSFEIKRFDLECLDCSSSGGGDNNQDIIINQNKNTQDIIINQNKNTQDIIINQNKNTQDIINNQNTNNNALLDKQQENINAIKDLTEQQKNTNDYLKDDNIDDSKNSANDFFSTFQTDTYGLTGIITAPLNLIKSITSSTCTGLPLTLPFVNDNSRSNNFVLPCMSSIYEEHFGSFLSIYQTITTGFISYWICVRIFNLVKDFKNPDHDEVEVLDL